MEKVIRISLVFLILFVGLAACSQEEEPTAVVEEPTAESKPTEKPAEEPKEVLRVGLNSENVPWEFMRGG